MGTKLDALFALQDIERQLTQFRDEADAKRRGIRVHQRALQKHEELVAANRTAITTSQMQIDQIDLSVKTNEESLVKHREALNRTKTNKEYAAILTAINTEKADNSKQETRQLELMSDQDALRATSEKCTAERDALVKRIAAAEQALQNYLDRVKPDTDRLTSEREVLADRIPPTTLAAFERVAEHHGGEAMAEIVVVNAKRDEHGCGGCNMSLTLQQVIAVQTSSDLQLCSSCGRILYRSAPGGVAGKSG